MTDYFALLEQPRQPWLDLEQLKEIYLEKTRHTHPDVQPNESSAAFADLNEAYQVLREPKRRLHHLLALQGEAPTSAPAKVPEEIERLFPQVAGVLREAEQINERITQAPNALARADAIAETATLAGRLRATLALVRGVEENALRSLHDPPRSEPGELRDLYFVFSYVSRWIAQLEERQLQLTLGLHSS